MPRVALVDQGDAPFDFERLHGQTLVVAFVYTRCPARDECPLVTAKLARMQQLIAGAPIHLVEMTVDPLRDRPALLERYGKAFGQDPQRWTLVTGPVGNVRGLEQRLGVEVATGPGGSLIHADDLLFIGPDGRIADRLGGVAWTSEEATARARTIAGLSSSPLDRIRLALVRGIRAACGGGVSGLSLGTALLAFLGLLAAFGFAASRVLASVSRR